MYVVDHMKQENMDMHEVYSGIVVLSVDVNLTTVGERKTYS